MAISVSSVLAKVPFFASVAEAELELLARSFQRRSVRAGKAVFRQDDPGSSLFVIHAGVVKIQRTSSAGKEVILAILGPGDFFGELALLDGEPRSADAMVKEDCAMLVLERDDFLAFLDKQPGVATKLLAALSRRLRRTDQLVQDAAFLDVPARLARALLQLSESPESATGLTQSELAAMVGASRESVNRWLQFYRRRGLIDSATGSIRVLQPDELRRHIY